MKLLHRWGSSLPNPNMMAYGEHLGASSNWRYTLENEEAIDG